MRRAEHLATGVEIRIEIDVLGVGVDVEIEIEADELRRPIELRVLWIGSLVELRVL